MVSDVLVPLNAFFLRASNPLPLKRRAVWSVPRHSFHPRLSRTDARFPGSINLPPALCVKAQFRCVLGRSLSAACEADQQAELSSGARITKLWITGYLEDNRQSRAELLEIGYIPVPVHSPPGHLAYGCGRRRDGGVQGGGCDTGDAKLKRAIQNPTETLSHPRQSAGAPSST